MRRAGDDGARRRSWRVREAGPADRDVIVEFNRALAEETEGRELDNPRLSEGVRALLADPTKGRYFLAEAPRSETGGRGPDTERRSVAPVGTSPVAPGGPEPAGVAGQLLITREWSDWRNGPVWWIQSVYVAPSHRRQGVYAALHRHVRERAKAEGVVGLRLYVERKNGAAQAAYRALGMRESRYVVFEEMWA